MTPPVPSGHLHLRYPTHPPPTWHAPLALFRPSHFPLGVIGIADFSEDAAPSLAAELRASIAEYFPEGSVFPLVSRCYAFEGEGSSTANLGSTNSEVIVIPNVMGHKKVYIGTLIGELCSDILGDFTRLVSTSDNASFMVELT